MAGVTLNQIALRIAGEQGEKKGDDSFIAQCETWLRDAMVEIDNETNFKAFLKNLTITTEVGVSLYDLPEDFRTIKYLRHTDTDEPIDYTNPKTLVQYGVDLEVSGRPARWWISDPRINASNQFIQRVRFQPVPNTILGVDGMYYFEVINVDSTDILPLTQQAILCLESRLRMFITKGDKEWTAYNVERSEYNKNLAGLIRSEVVKPSRNLVAKPTDLPMRGRRPARLRYPFE